MFKEVYVDYKKNKKEIIEQENKLNKLKSVIDEQEQECDELEKKKRTLEKEIINLSNKKKDLYTETKMASEENKITLQKKKDIINEYQNLQKNAKKIYGELKTALEELKSVDKKNEILKAVKTNYKEKTEHIQKKIDEVSIKTEFYKYYQDYISNDTKKLYISNFIDEHERIVEAFLIHEVGYYELKDSVVLLKDVFEKEDIRLGLEELSEYIKYEYITRIHKRVERKLNLFAIYNKDEDNLLPKIFSVYGNKMHDIEMLYYLSFELLNQNIKWNYSTIDEFKKLILQEYQLYHNDQFYKVITERKNEIKSSDLFVEDLNEINQMTGFEFEDFLKNVFLKLGYNVVNTKLSGDQGADLIINNKKVSYAVQAKRYKGVVGNTAVQEVIAGKNYYNCDEALVVTSGRFTKSAVELSEKTNVILWDSNKLIAAIKKINTSIKNIEQPLVDEKNKQDYIQDIETIKLEKEKQKLKKEIEALKYNKLQYEKDLLNAYKYIDISKEVNVYIQYLEKKNLVNKLFIEKEIPQKEKKYSIKNKEKFDLSMEKSKNEKIGEIVKTQAMITQERITPRLLKYYDEYQKNTEVNQIVSVFIDSPENSSIYSSILSPVGTWEYTKNKYLDKLSLLLKKAGLKKDFDLKILEHYLIYKALEFEYTKHSKVLEGNEIRGLDEHKALEKLIDNHNLRINYYNKIAYGDKILDQFSVDLLSFHLYRENVITKHKNSSQLITYFKESELIVEQTRMLNKIKRNSK